MSVEVTPELLADVKTMLNVTWTDAGTDSRLTILTQNGMTYLNNKLGASADYSQPGYARALLFEYVRYGRDEALDVFENNYRGLILAMQNERQVSNFVEKAKQTDSADLAAV